jgi:Tol biopolymer transport system component
MQPLLAGLLQVFASSLVASCVHSPLSWSQDGQWLAYTMVEPSSVALPRPGWIFESASPPASIPEGPLLPTTGRDVLGIDRKYRIWATDKATLSSVLIEESRFPLSAPAWGPDGHSVFFMRFFILPSDVGLGAFRGRCELVIQDALDRKRVISTVDGIELDREQLESFPEIKADWSPDGRYIAVPRPGRSPAILIVGVEHGLIQKTLETAVHPAWAPDGSRLAYLRPGRVSPASHILQVIGLDFVNGRSITEIAEMAQPPVWSSDGQTIMAVSRRGQARFRELELIRVGVETAFSTRVLTFGSIAKGDQLGANRMLSLGLDPRGPGALPRIRFGFDREQEQCVFLSEADGEVPLLGLGSTRQPMILKRFPVLDVTFRLGSLAVPPEGQIVAVRLETPGKLSPPLLCDVSSESIRLIAPDATTRDEWLSTLAATARSVLRASLPQPMIDGQHVDRPTLLPAPGEIADQSQALRRTRRLGKAGRALLDQSLTTQSAAAGDDSLGGEALHEFRLFFDYLKDDYAAAEADIDALESRTDSPDVRLRLLSARVQVLIARGEIYKARPMIEYLDKIQGQLSQRVEETPLGPVLTSEPSLGRLWPRYLAKVASAKDPSTSLAQDGLNGETGADEERLLTNPMMPGLGGLGANGNDGGGATPFLLQRRGIEFFDLDQRPPERVAPGGAQGLFPRPLLPRARDFAPAIPPPLPRRLDRPRPRNRS